MAALAPVRWGERSVVSRKSMAPHAPVLWGEGLVVSRKLMAPLAPVLWGEGSGVRGRAFDFSSLPEETLPARSVMLLQSLGGTGEGRVTA